MFQVARDPSWSVGFILVYVVVFGVAPLLRRRSGPEDSLDAAGALFNAGCAYGLFLLHTAVAFSPAMVGSQLIAAVVFLALAVALWTIRRSELACFVYAMAGYLALSVAILSAFTVPNVFVWLSLQSVLVVATALWFRSPFIVVANFFIYVAVVLGYVLVATRETGISFGFGVVALVSARILNWQKERLQLEDREDAECLSAQRAAGFPLRDVSLGAEAVCRGLLGGRGGCVLPPEPVDPQPEVPLDGTLHPAADSRILPGHRHHSAGPVPKSIVIPGIGYRAPGGLPDLHSSASGASRASVREMKVRSESFIRETILESVFLGA